MDYSDMTILLTSYYYKPHIGGVENSLFHIAQSFSQQGKRVFILASDADLSKKKRLPAYELIDGIDTFRFPRFIPVWTVFSVFSPFIDILRAAKVIRKINDNNAVDLALSRNHILGLAAKRAGIPLVYFHVSSIVKSLDRVQAKMVAQPSLKQKALALYINTLLNPLQQFLQNECLKKSTRIVVFSRNLKHQVAQIMPTVTGKVHVILPGVNGQSVMKSFDESERSFVFIILGRLIYAKRVDLAIDAMSLMPASVKLHIIGDGPLKKELQNKVSAQGLQERVLFFDSTCLVDKHYKQADCFLMTSEYETFGQTIIEAMSFGLPVIAFKNNEKGVQTSSDEIIEHEKNGYLCDFSISSLSDAMLKATRLTIKEREEIGHNNIKKTLEVYTWSNYTQQVLALEESI